MKKIFTLLLVLLASGCLDDENLQHCENYCKSLPNLVEVQYSYENQSCLCITNQEKAKIKLVQPTTATTPAPTTTSIIVNITCPTTSTTTSTSSTTSTTSLQTTTSIKKIKKTTTTRDEVIPLIEEGEELITLKKGEWITIEEYEVMLYSHSSTTYRMHVKPPGEELEVFNLPAKHSKTIKDLGIRHISELTFEFEKE